MKNEGTNTDTDFVPTRPGANVIDMRSTRERDARRYHGERELTDTGRVLIGLRHAHRMPAADPIARHVRPWWRRLTGAESRAEAVLSVLLTVVVCAACAALLAHALAGGFR